MTLCHTMLVAKGLGKCMHSINCSAFLKFFWVTMMCQLCGSSANQCCLLYPQRKNYIISVRVNINHICLVLSYLNSSAPFSIERRLYGEKKIVKSQRNKIEQTSLARLNGRSIDRFWRGNFSDLISFSLFACLVVCYIHTWHLFVAVIDYA